MDNMDRKPTLKRKAEREAVRESRDEVLVAEVMLLMAGSPLQEDDGSDGSIGCASEDMEGNLAPLIQDVAEENNDVQDEEEGPDCSVGGEASEVDAEDSEDCETGNEGSDVAAMSDVESEDGEDAPDDCGGGNEQPAVLPIENHEVFIRQQILEWTLAGGVSMSKVDDLLKRLKPVHPILPKSYKTLVRTPKCIDVVNCGNGYVWYFGIIPQLHRNLSREYFLTHDKVIIDVNIDSLPIFNKSNHNFVPILGRLLGVDEPFIIAIFCGDGSDPKDMDKFLESYVKEVNQLKCDGLMFENNVYDFEVRHYILDQKARASIKCVKGVRGYYCCEKCTVKGVDFANRMCLLEQNCPLRTDESFNELVSALLAPSKEDDNDYENVDEHVIGISPLLDCESKLVSKFRLDSMHLVYKGVFLRWLLFLWEGRGDCSLSLHERQEISDLIGSLREFCPSDFNRKPYAFKTVSKLKATELRRKLLYDGLVAFRGLDFNIYKNFLLLHCAIYILCSPKYHRTLNEEAHQFLCSFVSHSEDLFGPEFIVYNVHSLIHLAAECNEHGVLDSFGAFPFENRLGMIKASVTSRSKPLQQVAKREIERSRQRKCNAKPPPSQLQMPWVNDEDEEVCGQQFKKIVVKQATVAVSGADSCCQMEDGSVVFVENIILSENGPLLVGKKFRDTEDFYSYPIPSSLLDIYRVSNLQPQKMYWNAESVKHKCYFMPILEGYGVVVFVEADKHYVETIPTTWIDEDSDGNLIGLWPPNTWSEARIRKAIEGCDSADPDFVSYRIKLLHTYNSYLVARRNSKVAEVTSTLETEEEQLGAGHRKRFKRIVYTDDSGSDDGISRNRSSSHAAPPAIKTALVDKLKDKLSKSKPSKSLNKKSSSLKASSAQKDSSSLNGAKKAEHFPPETPVQHCKKTSPWKKRKLTASAHFEEKDIICDNDDSQGQSGCNEGCKDVERLDSPEFNDIDSPERGGSFTVTELEDISSPGRNFSISKIGHAESIRKVLSFESSPRNENAGGPSGESMPLSSSTPKKHPSKKQHKSSSPVKRLSSPRKCAVNKQQRSPLSKKGRSSPLSKKGGLIDKPLTAAEQRTLVSLVMELRKKAETAERLLTSILRAVKPSQRIVVPKDLVCLPIKCQASFEENEEYLSEKENFTDTAEYLAKFVQPGILLKDQVYAIMRKVMTDKLASGYNFKGTKEKLAFSESKLYMVVIGALLDANGTDPEKKNIKVPQVDTAIKEWLKYAPKRAGTGKGNSASSVETVGETAASTDSFADTSA